MYNIIKNFNVFFNLINLNHILINAVVLVKIRECNPRLSPGPTLKVGKYVSTDGRNKEYIVYFNR